MPFAFPFGEFNFDEFDFDHAPFFENLTSSAFVISVEESSPAAGRAASCLLLPLSVCCLLGLRLWPAFPRPRSRKGCFSCGRKPLAPQDVFLSRLPGPLRVLMTLWEQAESLLYHASITLVEIVLGLILGTVLGVATALLANAFAFARHDGAH